MTKKQVYEIIKDCIEIIEAHDIAGIEAFYSNENGEGYNENRKEFFEILQKALN